MTAPVLQGKLPIFVSESDDLSQISAVATHFPDENFERSRLLASAFEHLEIPSRPFERQSPLLYSPIGILAALSGCSDHPPLHGEPGPSDAGSTDGGHDAGPRPDAGGNSDAAVDGGSDAAVDGSGGADGGSDGGVDAGPICQVRFPVAVMFYDCVDMAPLGGATTRVCASEEHFGGDVAAARSFVERGLRMTQELYVNGCAPMAIEPVFFYPDRVLNAREGTPHFDFFGSAVGDDGTVYYAINPDIPGFSAEIAALGDDPTRFGAITVINGWSYNILASYYPGTYDYSWRATPPFAVVGLNLHEETHPDVPATLRWTFRHEFTHALDYVSRHYAFPRPIYVHTPPVNPACPYGGDAHWLCKAEHDGNGVPMLAEDWALALGAVGVPVSCEDPAYLSHCAEAPTVTCGTTVCPDLPQFSAYCNTENYCEYSPETVSEPWQLYNRFIYVPPGASFTLGSNPGDLGYSAAEAPATDITFGMGYFLGKYEVTTEAYEACRAAGACLAHNTYGWDGGGWGVNQSATRPLHPANHLDINGAGALCEFLAAGGRLPSRPEWEFGARGPSSQSYPFGDSAPLCSESLASFNELGSAAGYGCSSGGTRPVDSMPMGVSPIGAFNMAGNVWEFIGECWAPDQSGVHADGTPRHGGCLGSHELAGGGFNDPASSLRGATRIPLYWNFGNANVGVRCAISASWVYE